MKSYREQLKERNSRAAELREIIRTGEEKRDAQQQMNFDPDTGEVNEG